MNIDLNAIEARAKAAAPGPWTYVDNGFDGYIMSASEYLIVGGEPAEGRIEPDDPNADFIAHSREDIPDLLSEVERLNSEMQLENTQPKPDDKCREDDGCPTENAVLRREWRKLTEQLSYVTAERDEEIARAEKAEEDIEILASHLDPCEICESKRNCVHPASCPERNHSSFRYCGAGKEQNNG